MSRRELSRRELFSFWRRATEPDPPEAPAPPPPPQYVLDPGLPVPLRPPGAVDEQRFADLCQRCGRCIEVCPVHAIRPLPESYGVWSETPHILARQQPCVMCEGLLCTTVCPSGSLRPIERADCRIGRALRDWERCLPFNQVPCDACHRVCPVPGAIYLDAHQHPHVDGMKCTGCGLCEKACPVEPSAIVVRPVSADG